MTDNTDRPGIFQELTDEQQAATNASQVTEAAITAQLAAVIQSMTSGGGGGGGGLSDTVLTDDSGTYFLSRDVGAGVTYVTLAGATYTPTTNIRPPDIALLQQLLTGLQSLSTGVGQIHTDNGVIEVDLGQLHTDNTSIISGVSTLHTDSQTVHGDLQSVNTNLGTIHTDTSTIATGVGTLHSDAGTIETDIVATTTAVQTLHTDNMNTQTSLGTLHSDNVTTASDLAQLHTDTTGTTSAVQALHTDNATIEGDLNTLHTDMSGVGTGVSQLHTDAQAEETTLTAIENTLSSTGVEVAAGSNVIGKVGIDQSNPGVSNQVSLAAGTTMTVAGLTAPTDQSQAFVLSTSYSTSASTGSQQFLLNGVGTANLFVIGGPTGYQIQVYGSLNGGLNYTFPLELVPVRQLAETTNGPPTTGIGLQAIYRLNCAGFNAIQVRANVLGSGGSYTTIQGIMTANGCGGGLVAISDPVCIESVRDTFNYSLLNAAFTASSSATEILAYRNSSIGKICQLEMKGKATAASWVPYILYHSLGVNSGETNTTAMSSSSHFDSNDGFEYATQTAIAYETTQPTTLSGSREILYQGELYVPALGTPTPNPFEVIEFGKNNTHKTPAIRSGEQFSLNFPSGVPAGFLFTTNLRVTSHQ